MKNIEMINKKMANINTAITDIANNKKILHKFGSEVLENKAEEVKFQQHRVGTLRWAAEHEYSEIVSQIKELESGLTKDELNCKYGIQQGLSLDTIVAISDIELLEASINEHGKHKGGWN